MDFRHVPALTKRPGRDRRGAGVHQVIRAPAWPNEPDDGNSRAASVGLATSRR
jgi:hypothetical protein